uniref:MULE transposase domain-containing protein n=1 Tax=Lactuca sativa TaxID=4236 RepID=A0A9R1WX81_LACSA|nr:hypothetical protein LSAT_V11C800439760 [Lactuca sativa]
MRVTIVQMDEIDENDDNENHTTEVQDLPSPPRSSPVEVEVQPLHVEVHDRQKELIANDFMEAATKFDMILQSNADVHEHVQVEVEKHVQDEVEEHAQVKVEENAQDEVELDHGHEDAMEDNLDNYIDNYMDDYMSSHCDEEDDSEDSKDSDWVDEENIIPEVEVDMRDFHMSIDNEAEFFEKRLRNSMEKDRNQEHEDMELDVIDNDEWDSADDDSEMGKKRRQLGKEKRCSLGEVHKPTFRIEQKYKSKKELEDKIAHHALETRKNLFIKKNDKLRLRTTCKGKVVFNEGQVDGPTTGKKSKGKSKKTKTSTELSCQWVLQASRKSEEKSWCVKTYQPEHSCLNTRKVRTATENVLSKQIMDLVESNPTVPIKVVQELLQKRYKVSFSKDKVFRAIADAKKHVMGDYTKQYDVLRDYILELQSTNPDTTVKLELVQQPNLMFSENLYLLRWNEKRVESMIKGFYWFRWGLRERSLPRADLYYSGLDSNNGIYPLAYAIVESENTKSWKWFLEYLGDDLDLSQLSNFTFISDRQKFFPVAEHKFCLIHIYENMRKRWRTTEYKDRLWNCAKATTVQEFNRLMKEFSEYDIEAYEWLQKIPPQHWA